MALLQTAELRLCTRAFRAREAPSPRRAQMRGCDQGRQGALSDKCLFACVLSFWHGPLSETRARTLLPSQKPILHLSLALLDFDLLDLEGADLAQVSHMRPPARTWRGHGGSGEASTRAVNNRIPAGKTVSASGGGGGGGGGGSSSSSSSSKLQQCALHGRLTSEVLDQHHSCCPIGRQQRHQWAFGERLSTELWDLQHTHTLD